MRKKLTVVVIVLGISIFGLLGYCFFNTLSEKEAEKERISTLPEFILIDSNGNEFGSIDILDKYYKVFIFFNSECYYCQEEASQLYERRNAIPDNVFFFWISSEPTHAIDSFAQEYQLDSIKQCKFLFDCKGQLADLLAIDTTPRFLVYGSDNNLLKSHQGAWRIDNLLENLKNGFKTYQ